MVVSMSKYVRNNARNPIYVWNYKNLSTEILYVDSKKSERHIFYLDIFLKKGLHKDLNFKQVQ